MKPELILPGIPPGGFKKAIDIAKIYNVTKSTIYKWAEDKKIPSIHFVDTVRFDETAVRIVIEGL